MDKSAIDTPSREIDPGNIPVHLRTALRRALEFEARAPAPSSAEEAEQCEEQLRAIADEFFGALLTPVLQRAVRSAAVGDAASALVRHLPRRMRSDGLETVNVRTSRGTTVPVTTPYYREKHARRAKRRPGLYPALVVLGIYDRCTPKLASDASRAVAMLSSLAEAQAQLRSEGIALDIKTLRSTAYRYAARARAAQQSAACGLLDRVTGKRVVVSLDGGRVRVRRKKRGPKTQKGRNRFHTDWKEPKLLILYVVGDDGRPSQTWAPIIDGTLRGPEAVFALLLSYACSASTTFAGVALPHLGMLPTVLRKIVLRFQPGTGQFLVTRPARARWRDSIGGNVSAHHRVSCPVHASARHAGDLVDDHGLYGTGCRRRRRAPDTGHRSLNPNVTPPGLRPGAREGEPQATRCRSRVSVPSSAVERGPGRSARPVGRRHAQASRAGQRPGRTEPPRGRPDNRGAAAWQWAGSAPSPRRRAPRWRSRRPPRAVRNRMSPSPSGTGHRSLNPNVTPPGLRPGAREGEPQARRCRSRVSVPSSAVERGPGRSA